MELISNYEKYIQLKNEYIQLKKMYGGGLNFKKINTLNEVIKDINKQFFSTSTDSIELKYSSIGNLDIFEYKKKSFKKKGDIKIIEKFFEKSKGRQAKDLKHNRIIESFVKLFNTELSIPLYHKYGYINDSHIIEFKIFGLIHLIDKSPDKDTKVSCKLLLKKLWKYSDNLNHKHKDIFNDKDVEISGSFKEIVKKYIENMDYEDIYDTFTTNPKILFEPKYKDFLPKFGQNLRKHQIELLTNINKIINDNNDNNNVIFYKTIMGSGKTFSAPLLVHFLKQKFQKINKRNRPKLIFCCKQPHVLNEVYKLINHIDHDNVHLVEELSKKTKDIANSVSNIVCDPKSFMYLQDNNIITENTILFFDEPTMDSTQLFNESLQIPQKQFMENIVTEYNTNNFNLNTNRSKLNIDLALNAKIMMSKSKIKILSSATLSDENKYNEIFPHDIKLSITGNEIYIASTVKTHNNKLYMPHALCTTKDEYRIALDMIKNNIFLKKMYSIEAFKVLYDKIQECNIERPIINIPANLQIKNIVLSNITTMTIINYSLSLLELLLIDDISDECIETFCKLELSDDDDIQFINVDKKVQNLIVTNEPMNFASEHNEELLEIYNDKDLTNFMIYNKDDRIEENNNTGSLSKELQDFTGRLSINLRNLLDKNIGIYSNDIQYKSYLNFIKKKAEHKQLQCLITDINIAYGTNYPISVIHIDKNVTKNETINTIFQLFNRAGRSGTWFATIYVENYFLKRLSNVIKKRINYDFEVKNVLNMYKILDKHKDKNFEFEFYKEKKEEQNIVNTKIYHNNQKN